MSITATVEKGSIKLPVHVPDGTQVEITLPQSAASGGPAADRGAAEQTEAPTILGRYAWLNDFVGCIEGPSDLAAEHDH